MVTTHKILFGYTALLHIHEYCFILKMIVKSISYRLVCIMKMTAYKI